MTQVHLQNPASQRLADQLATALSGLDRDNVVDRLWRKGPHPVASQRREISNRLGWLDLVGQPPERDQELIDFIDGVRADGLTDAVLLGMGGSSLGAEALRTSFPAEEGDSDCMCSTPPIPTGCSACDRPWIPPPRYSSWPVSPAPRPRC